MKCWQDTKDKTLRNKEKQCSAVMTAKEYIPQSEKTAECNHLELISYKVHKDQFKQLLVPNRLSGVRGDKTKGRKDTNNDHPSDAGSEFERNTLYSDNTSTEGEESELNSPTCLEKQSLTQSNEIMSALIHSNALKGDYIELKNCKRCGSMIFKDLSSAIKDKREDFNADISPA